MLRTIFWGSSSTAHRLLAVQPSLWHHPLQPDALCPPQVVLAPTITPPMRQGNPFLLSRLKLYKSKSSKSPKASTFSPSSEETHPQRTTQIMAVAALTTQTAMATTMTTKPVALWMRKPATER